MSKAGLSGDPAWLPSHSLQPHMPEVYVAMLEDAIAYARASASEDQVALAMDKLAVNLGVAISKLVSGYISTEVDPRLSFNKAPGPWIPRCRPGGDAATCPSHHRRERLGGRPVCARGII